ncbi:sugar phosphate nucleotidyltransferase, partial [Limosilactobacillus fermentum]
TLAVMRVPHEDTAKYGVINPSKEVMPGLYNVTSFVEKPEPKDAPSDLAIIGRYVFTPEIFDVLAKTKPGKGNEIQLTDAINTLNKTQRVFAHEYKGHRYDVGNKFGWIETNIEYGLKHPETKDELREYIKDLGVKFAAEDKKKPAK